MKSPLLDDESAAAAFAAGAPTTPIRLSPLRFYCLLIITLIAGLQGAWWNNFGPIAAAVKPFYGWDDATIALLSNWGPIAYFIAVGPTAYMIDEWGLRSSSIVASGLLFAGSLCRCVHVARDTPSAALMHVGQFLNNLAGPVAMSAGPALSAQWFAPNERTAATAIVGGANYGFSAITFALGPLLVPSMNGTLDDTPAAATAAGLRIYMLGQAAITGALFLGALAFPSRPPFPPSRSAATTRSSFWHGLRKLSRQRVFWCLAICYGASSGVFAGWGSMLGPNMENVLPADIAEREAGWMGFWGALLGMSGGVALGRFADTLGRKKGLLLTCCLLAAGGFALFAAFCSGTIHVPYYAGGRASDGGLMLALYVSSIAATIFLNSTTPLFMEMAVEAVHPIAEGLTTSTLTTMNNVGCLTFLLMQNIPNVGTAWMNWACAGACALGFVAILPLDEVRGRYAIDVAAADVGAAHQAHAAEVAGEEDRRSAE